MTHRIALRTGLVSVLLAAVLLGISTPSFAHSHSSEHGRASIHQTEAPDDEADHTVTCDFFVRGSGFAWSSGTIFASRNNTLDDDAEALGDWTGQVKDDGTYSFFAGPFSHGSFGTWFVHVADGDEREHSAVVGYTYAMDDEPCSTPGFVPPPCPGDLAAHASTSGIELSWSYGTDDGHFRIMRDGTEIAELDDTARSYVDSDVEAGRTYEYAVYFDDGIGAREDCESVEVTAVPFFGGIVLAGVAALGALAAMVWFRAR